MLPAGADCALAARIEPASKVVVPATVIWRLPACWTGFWGPGLDVRLLETTAPGRLPSGPWRVRLPPTSKVMLPPLPVPSRFSA